MLAFFWACNQEPNPTFTVTATELLPCATASDDCLAVRCTLRNTGDLDGRGMVQFRSDSPSLTNVQEDVALRIGEEKIFVHEFHESGIHGRVPSCFPTTLITIYK